ncbi:helix-turn-helix domain-containing protein [Nocardioides sp. P86]|uniref:helix-turn-helix domain-containing protein n=1 Tax=Nocardioides sp. P86 TaxID=2939569 RepID=UPI00203E4DAA|nr:helix-turn-helix domain-containing protein [Nocardioides sp. P86]MCM3514383.1 helix-turn-helix domain-containing protein [Nocardioides sp. P86]
MRSREWIDSRQAAEVLGLTRSQAVWLARRGRIPAEQREGRWVFDAAHVRADAAERRGWVSWREAADLADCTEHALWEAVAAGHVEQRAGRGPSLRRDSVLAWARSRRVRGIVRTPRQGCTPGAGPTA